MSNYEIVHHFFSKDDREIMGKTNDLVVVDKNKGMWFYITHALSRHILNFFFFQIAYFICQISCISSTVTYKIDIYPHNFWITERLNLIELLPVGANVNSSADFSGNSNTNSSASSNTNSNARLGFGDNP